MDFLSANFPPPKKSWNVAAPVKRNESLIRTSKARGELEAGPWYIQASYSFNLVLNRVCKKEQAAQEDFTQSLEEIQRRVYSANLFIECLGLRESFLFSDYILGSHFRVHLSNTLSWTRNRQGATDMIKLICQSLNKIRTRPGKSRPTYKENFAMRVWEVPLLPSLNLCTVFIYVVFFFPSVSSHFFFFFWNFPTLGELHVKWAYKVKGETGC